MTAGWVYIGDRFVDDFLDAEGVAGVELLFPGDEPGHLRPAFQKINRQRSGEGGRS